VGGFLVAQPSPEGPAPGGTCIKKRVIHNPSRRQNAQCVDLSVLQSLVSTRLETVTRQVLDFRVREETRLQDRRRRIRRADDGPRARERARNRE